jgi:S-DNA-T family DNA segregation ATPase FtsK/SpoIIIE
MLHQPHLLIAGATGSGKSVIINALIYTALYDHPTTGSGGSLFILIDPKRVELSQYKDLPHVLKYASEPDEMRNALYYAMQICENRYKEMDKNHDKLYKGGDVYIIIDEFADLMTTQKRLICPVIQRLAQIGRAAKIHIILATQTPISKVLPTEIKCNFDSRVALRTRSAQDSRNITGLKGCETLPRYGYAYYMTPEKTGLTKIPMIPENELQDRVRWWTNQKSPVKRLFNRLA